MSHSLYFRIRIIALQIMQVSLQTYNNYAQAKGGYLVIYMHKEVAKRLASARI